MADLLKLIGDLVAIFADGSNMILTTLRLHFLDRGDDSQADTASADHVPEGSTEKVLFVRTELITELRDFIHVRDHVIVALSPLAEASEEGLAVTMKSVLGLWSGGQTCPSIFKARSGW